MDPNKRNELGEAEIHKVIQRDLVELKELLKMGGNPNLSDAEGWTPLHHACLKGSEDMIRTLLDHGADVNIKNDDGKKPFDLLKNKAIQDRF